MKKAFLISLLMMSSFVSSCDWKNSSQTSTPNTSQNSPIYSTLIYTVIIPQTIVLNDITYNMIIDIDHTLVYELDQLIGHIIHEDALPKYTEDYPNLLPVIDNQIKNQFSNDMIEIYSVKDKDIIQYLAINIDKWSNTNTELFKADYKNII